MTPQTPEELRVALSDCYIPEKMWGGFERYFFDKIRPGSFLYAVLCNDLMMSAANADDENMRLLPNYANFLYNYMGGGGEPGWGSEEAVQAWIKSRG